VRTHSPVIREYRYPFAVLSAELEVRSTAPIHPDLVPVKAPGLVLDAGRSTTLVDQSNAAACICVAEVSFAIVGGAGNLPATARRIASSTARIPTAVIAAAKPEIGAAASIDPDATSVVSPGLVLDTWRSAALVNHANAVLGRYLAKVTLSVVGGARNLASILRSDTALRAQPDTTERNEG
jgi:hypothetical protein